MTNKIEYLEKYTTAPSPSRDYYGLKVIDEKVIVYVWRVSHGPHKLPVTHTINFSDFQKNKNVQDEIFRGFGELYLEYVKNITNGNRNLLTLPKSLIGKIARYLQPHDIINLSELSPIAKELFNNKTIWESISTCNVRKPHYSKNKSPTGQKTSATIPRNNVKLVSSVLNKDFKKPVILPLEKPFTFSSVEAIISNYKRNASEKKSDNINDLSVKKLSYPQPIKVTDGKTSYKQKSEDKDKIHDVTAPNKPQKSRTPAKQSDAKQKIISTANKTNTPSTASSKNIQQTPVKSSVKKQDRTFGERNEKLKKEPPRKSTSKKILSKSAK